MAKSEDIINDSNLESRRCSTSTIDSDTAAQIVRQYEHLEKCPYTINYQPTQSNSVSPKVHNTMTFDKSEGIHVGDVINYYCSTPPYQVPNQSGNNIKTSISHSDSTIISTVSYKKNKIISFFSHKLNIILIVISIIIIIITGGIFFMIRYKAIDVDITDTTTIKIILSTSISEVDVDSTTNFPTTTTSEMFTTTSIEQTSPTIPPIIALESFVSRTQWNAEQPRATVDLNLPIHRIIIAHTASEGCESEEECMNFVQELQRNSTYLDDIPYNFLIGNDSKVYEGRGIIHEGQHLSNNYATEYNSIGICVAFIGNYEHERLSESQIKVFNEFIKYFVDLRLIHENYTIFLQDQLIYTLVPASSLEETVENWKGFRRLQKVYHRDDWQAQAPRLLSKFDIPMNWSIITSTGTKKCFDFTNCTSAVQNLQIDAFAKNFDDIPFAFVIGGDGLIFEGRGWDYVGQHSPGFDTITVAICVIGAYGVVTPSQSIINATKNLLDDGAALGKLTNDYIINGRQELKLIFSGPGGDFLAVIRTWDRWKYLGRPKSRKNK